MKALLLTAVSMIFAATVYAADAAAPAAPTTPATTTPAPADGGHEMHKDGAMKAMHDKMKEERKEMKSKMEDACKADMDTTNCHQEMGKGMMKCMMEYKKAHKDFKWSDSCKAAMAEGKAMRKEHKEEKKDMKKGDK
ncbi:MAG: hypothetical protein ACXWQQ_02835 [Pseudobdellovibrio sp.]